MQILVFNLFYFYHKLIQSVMYKETFHFHFYWDLYY